MKKQLFTILTALSFGSVMAQVASPSWTTLQSPSFTIPVSGCRFVDAVDANVVWLSGYDGQAPNLNYNFFSRTTNGGLSYTSGNVFPDTNSWTLSNLEGLDANTAWVCAYNKATGGSGALYRTTNGGAAWVNMTPPGMYTNTAAFGNWIAFLDNNTAVVNGDPVNGDMELWRTTDGGSTFTMVPGTSIPDPLSQEYAIVDMYATFGPSHIWFGTNKGRVYRSSDAGVTWNVSVVKTAVTSTIIEVRFASATNGLALVSDAGGLTLHNTFDGGVTWNQIPGGPNGVPVNYGINEMARVPGTTYFVSAGNSANVFAGLSYSKDNGVTWTDWGSTGIGYVSIDFADRWHGWAGGFTNIPDQNWPGIFKYDGNTFNSVFTVPQAVCISGSNVTVTPTNNSGSASGPVTFFWSSSPTAQFSSATASVPVITFNTAGTYTITLAVDDGSGIGYHSQVITVANCAAPVASFSVKTAGCNGESIILDNTSTGSPAPSVTVSTNPSANVQITNVSNQYKLVFADPGTYTINMNVSSIAGNSSHSQTIQISDCRAMVSFVIPELVCRKQDTVSIIHNVTGGTALTHSFMVQPGAGVQITDLTTGVVRDKRLVFINHPSAFGITSYTIITSTENLSGISTYSQAITVTPDDCVGLNEHSDWRSQLSIYPNPARENLYINLPANVDGYNLKVINVLGAVVHAQSAGKDAQEVKVKLSGLSKGVYFVEIQSGSNKATRKFIVE